MRGAHLLDQTREALAPLMGPGRAFGAAMARDPGLTRAMADLPLMAAISRLGLDPGESMAARIATYEALAHIDISLATGAPGPVMTGFVHHALADPAQMARLHDQFARHPAWSCFALTERHAGTDAAAIETRATRIEGGWRLDGHKYMVGQGVTADLVVVFARSAAGPLGVEAFVLHPADHPGYRARRLPLTGCQGTNLSEITLDGIELPETARLGAHLKPAERAQRAVSATFDVMRPCVAAMALGLARSVLDRAEETGLLRPGQTAQPRLRLRALLDWALRLGLARDAGQADPQAAAREAGLVKVASAAAASEVIGAVLAAMPARVLADQPWLARAWRDAAAFEYAEGVAAIHRLNASTAFRQTERNEGGAAHA